VTGLDLVKLQIAIAAGHRLPFAWESITHAATPWKSVCTRKIRRIISFRRPGKFFRAARPAARNSPRRRRLFRLDRSGRLRSASREINRVGNSREETIARLRRALEEYSVTGIKTNTALFRRILVEPDFLRSEIHTKWLDEMLTRPHAASDVDSRAADAAAIAAALWHASHDSAFRSSSRGKMFALENGPAARARRTACHEVRNPHRREAARRGTHAQFGEA